MAEHRWAELDALEAGSWRGAEHTGVAVPRLADLLALVAQDFPTAAAAAGDAEIDADAAAVIAAIRSAGLRCAVDIDARCLDGPLLERTRARGCDVHVWTVNDPAAVRGFAALGVTGIITDDPAMARAVLVGVR